MAYYYEAGLWKMNSTHDKIIDDVVNEVWTNQYNIISSIKLYALRKIVKNSPDTIVRHFNNDDPFWID